MHFTKTKKQILLRGEKIILKRNVKILHFFSLTTWISSFTGPYLLAIFEFANTPRQATTTF